MCASVSRSRSRILAVASMPSISGISTSISTTSKTCESRAVNVIVKSFVAVKSTVRLSKVIEELDRLIVNVSVTGIPLPLVLRLTVFVAFELIVIEPLYAFISVGEKVRVIVLLVFGEMLAVEVLTENPVGTVIEEILMF